MFFNVTKKITLFSNIDLHCITVFRIGRADTAQKETEIGMSLLHGVTMNLTRDFLCLQLQN